MENITIGQKVKYKGKTYTVLRDLGNGRYDIKCSCGSRAMNVHKDQLNA